MSARISWRAGSWSPFWSRCRRGGSPTTRSRRVKAGAGSGRGRGRSTIDGRFSGGAGLLGRERAILERKSKPFPYVDQSLGQGVDHRVFMEGRRRDAQPLGSLGHRRIVDGLNVDSVIGEQEVGRLLALFGV